MVQCAHLEKYEFVNGKDDIPYMMENKTFSKPPTRLILTDQWIIPSFPAKHQYDYGKFQKCLKPPARFSHPSLWFTKAGMARHFSVKSAPWAVTRMLTSRRKGKGREDRLSWGSVVGQFGLPEFCFESLTVFLSQLGWLFLIYGKLNMFQTTNQLY